MPFRIARRERVTRGGDGEESAPEITDAKTELRIHIALHAIAPRRCPQPGG
jgi:hypothetical protein